jgi:hypothetical protein
VIVWYDECQYAKCRYAECRYAECSYAERQYEITARDNRDSSAKISTSMNLLHKSYAE